MTLDFLHRRIANDELVVGHLLVGDDLLLPLTHAKQPIIFQNATSARVLPASDFVVKAILDLFGLARQTVR